MEGGLISYYYIAGTGNQEEMRSRGDCEESLREKKNWWKALFQWMEKSIDFLSMVRFLLEILVGKLILTFCNAKNTIFIEIGWEIIFLKNFILGMKLQLDRGNCIKNFLLNLLSLEHFNLISSYFWNS